MADTAIIIHTVKSAHIQNDERSTGALYYLCTNITVLIVCTIIEDINIGLEVHNQYHNNIEYYHINQNNEGTY